MPDVRVGGRVADYRLDSLLGRGGMGVVYLAEHVQLRRRVALKVLPPELAADEMFRRRFIRESQLAALIDHPNIIPIYDASETDGVLYIAMRYIDGADLDTLIKAEFQIDAARTVSILGQVASALDVAHSEGLIHRDVKPANILIAIETVDGERREHAYLSDFGLTRQASSQTALTGSGQVLGTVAYLAPEVIEGKSVSAQIDQYSLGCVAYECLTGSRPFEREYEAAVMWAHMQAERPRVTEMRRELPPAVDDVVARAMAMRPQERYATCGDFVEGLRDALAVDTAAIPRIGVRRRRILPARVRRRLRTWPVRAAAATVALALVAATLVLVWPRSTPIDLLAMRNVVASLDPGTGSIERAFRIGDAPSALALDGASLWVTNQGDGTVRRVDTRTGRATIAGVTTRPTAVTTGGGDAWVLGGFPTSVVYPFDLRTGQKGSEIALDTNAEEIAAGAGAVWVTDLSHRTLIRIDPKTDERKNIETGGIPTGVAVGLGAVWVTVDAGARDELLRIDPKTDRAVRAIPLRRRANGVAVGDSTVWVANGDDGSVTRVDPRSARVEQTVRVGGLPVDVAVGDGAVWVADTRTRSIERVDPSTGKVQATRVGLLPSAVAVGAAGVWAAANPDVLKPKSEICPDEIPINEPTTCFTLTVPERHTDPGGRTTQIWFARIKSPKKNPPPDPVVVVGNNLAEHAEYSGAQPLPARTGREVINVDLRGVGFSTPNLACPEVERVKNASLALRIRDPSFRKGFLAAVSACHARLEGKGIDVGAYNITEAAADIEDLRRALGFRQWNLRALGYTSRVAFEVMRDFPDGVRAAWFDSPKYPQSDFFTEAATATRDAVATLDAACRSDQACNRRFPDVRGAFERAVEGLNAHPARVTITDPTITKAKRLEVAIDGDALVRRVRQDLATTGSVSNLPARIYGALQGRIRSDPDSMAAAFAAEPELCAGYRSRCRPPAEFTHGVALSTLCHDEAPFTNRRALAAVGRAYAEDFGRNPYIDVCGVWNVGRANASTHSAIRSAIPVLIMHGQYDPYFPFSASKVGARGLTRSFVYEVPGQGYNALGSGGCPLSIRNAWINKPTVAPDVSCLGDLGDTLSGRFDTTGVGY